MTDENGNYPAPGKAFAPKHEQDLPTLLGLKPYGDFVKKIGPLLRRLDQEERDRILKQLYSRTRKKLVVDFITKAFKGYRRKSETEQEDEFPEDYGDLEGKMIFAVQDGAAARVTINPISTPFVLPDDWRGREIFEFVFPGPKVAAVDYSFIKELENCLPPATPEGKRSRFGRAMIMEKVFEFIDQRHSLSRFSKIRAKQHRGTKN